MPDTFRRGETHAFKPAQNMIVLGEIWRGGLVHESQSINNQRQGAFGHYSRIKLFERTSRRIARVSKRLFPNSGSFFVQLQKPRACHVNFAAHFQVFWDRRRGSKVKQFTSLFRLIWREQFSRKIANRLQVLSDVVTRGAVASRGA